jgi:hypothetical protein
LLLSLIAAGACRPDAGLNVVHALLLTTIIDDVGLKIGAVRVTQIWGAVIAWAEAHLDIDERKDWISPTIFSESVASALNELLRTLERVENGPVHL